MERINDGVRSPMPGAPSTASSAAAHRTESDCVPAGSAHVADGVERDWLLGTIEAEIIPRLMLGHPPKDATLHAASPVIGDDEVARFVDVILDRGLAECMDEVAAFMRCGVALETIFLDLLCRSARRLGTLWEDDARSFAEVTAGLWRLQHVMMELSPRAHLASAGRSAPGHDRAAVVVAMPGSQHTFGAFMLSEVMLNAGWRVWTRPAVDAVELSSLLREQWFDVICLSISTDSQLRDAPALIHACRRASLNGGLLVAAGGPLLNGVDPAVVRRLGADLGGAEARPTERAIRALLRERAKSAVSWA